MSIKVMRPDRWDHHTSSYDTSCELWAVSCKLRAVRCELRALCFCLRTSKCELWSVNCELWAARCELRAANCETINSNRIVVRQSLFSAILVLGNHRSRQSSFSAILGISGWQSTAVCALGCSLWTLLLLFPPPWPMLTFQAKSAASTIQAWLMRNHLLDIISPTCWASPGLLWVIPWFFVGFAVAIPFTLTNAHIPSQGCRIHHSFITNVKPTFWTSSPHLLGVTGGCCGSFFCSLLALCSLHPG